jgi:predicted PurR-regulated permease PerM
MLPPASIPPLTPRRVVLATIVISLTLLAFWLLYLSRDVLIILFVAIVLSLAIRPLVVWLNKHNIPRGVGVAIVYLGLLGLVAGFILLLVPLIADQLTAIVNSIPDGYRQLRTALLNSNNWLVWRLGIELPVILPFMAGEPPPDEEALVTVGQAWGYANILFRAALVALTIILLGFYWTLDGERITRSILLLLPQESRGNARELITTVESKVGAYIFGQGLLCLFIAAMNLIAFVLIGIPYALVLALFAGLMEALPMIGPILGAVPAVVLALSLGETNKVLWVIAATIIIQQLENAVLVPRIMRQAVGVNPLVTLLALLAFSSVLGVVGALIAIPLAVILQILVDRYLLTAEDALVKEEITGRTYSSRLRYEVQQLTGDIRKLLRAKSTQLEGDEDKLEDEIENIALELDAMLAEVENDGLESAEKAPRKAAQKAVEESP